MKRIIELLCIFLLIIVIFVIVQPKIKVPENYENKLVNNNLVSDNVYKISTDLDYASMRYGLNLNHTDKISKNEKPRTPEAPRRKNKNLPRQIRNG